MHCRIYIETELQLHDHVQIDPEQAKYLRQVMRLQAGDVIIVFNGLGGEYRAELTFLAKEGGECVLTDYLDVDRELPCDVHVIQAANRSEKIETVIQKGTELGAKSFQIINSERATLALPANKQEKRLSRWQKIIVEAAEQSERTMVPIVEWKDKLAMVEKRGRCFVLHPRDAIMWEAIRNEVPLQREITIAVGPEGGWTNQELSFLQAQGFEPLLFGARVMRTETAAPALLAAIQAVL